MSWKSLLFPLQGLANLALSHRLLIQTLDDILLFFNQKLCAETVLCYDVLTYRMMQINKALEMHKQWSQHKNMYCPAFAGLSRSMQAPMYCT